ncbi:hypothetical protein [Aquimarina rhabdastrellae]
MSHISNEDLWKALINRLKNDWNEKYQDFGSIENIKHQTKFCKVLSKDISQTLNHNEILITWNTLHIYFKQNGFGISPQKKKLEVIKDYLGRDLLFHSQTKENKPLIKEEKKEIKSLSPISETLTEEDSFTLKNQTSNALNKDNSFARKSIYVAFGSLLLLLISSFWIYSQQNELSESELRMEKEKIIALIDRANALEFSLYAAVPNISDTIKLNKFYIPDSQNKKEIVRIISKNKAKGNILDTESSYRMLNKQAIIFDRISKSYAEVITLESWNLQWLHALDSTKYAEYKVVNEQRYTLQKHNDKWLILKNEYEGQATWFDE